MVFDVSGVWVCLLVCLFRLFCLFDLFGWVIGCVFLLRSMLSGRLWLLLLFFCGFCWSAPKQKHNFPSPSALGPSGEGAKQGGRLYNDSVDVRRRLVCVSIGSL